MERLFETTLQKDMRLLLARVFLSVFREKYPVCFSVILSYCVSLGPNLKARQNSPK